MDGRPRALLKKAPDCLAWASSGPSESVSNPRGKHRKWPPRQKRVGGGGEGGGGGGGGGVGGGGGGGICLPIAPLQEPAVLQPWERGPSGVLAELGLNGLGVPLQDCAGSSCQHSCRLCQIQQPRLPRGWERQSVPGLLHTVIAIMNGSAQKHKHPCGATQASICIPAPS